MSKIAITNSAQFQEVINSLEQSFEKIKELFDNQKKNKEQINGTDTWTGATAEVMYEKYSQLAQNFEPIEYSLELYIKFLKKTLEDYTLAEQAINKDIDETAEALDVVS